ncbi:MAG: hypothetical protein QM755_24285 [Luteolibacter sp.]
MKELLVGCIGLLGLVSCKEDKAAATGGAERKATAKPVAGVVEPGEKATEERRQAAPRPKQEKKPENPVATVVEGQPGFVVSPFNKKIVDVRNIPAGTLVRDPTYPVEERRFFQIPESSANPKPSQSK